MCDRRYPFRQVAQQLVRCSTALTALSVGLSGWTQGTVLPLKTLAIGTRWLAQTIEWDESYRVEVMQQCLKVALCVRTCLCLGNLNLDGWGSMNCLLLAMTSKTPG